MPHIGHGGRQRIVDGIYKPRYRNRLQFERTFKLGKMELTPYGDVE